MRKYHNVEVRRTETRFVEQNCDLCGATAVHPGNNWSGGGYTVDETEITVTVKQKEGTQHPEGGSGEEYNIDICPTCFKNRLVPRLISQGANIKQEEWDW